MRSPDGGRYTSNNRNNNVEPSMPTATLPQMQSVREQAGAIRQQLTEAIHQDPATFDLLRGSKTAIEAKIAEVLSAPTAKGGTSTVEPQRRPVRETLDMLAKFACDNAKSSSGVLIRDLLAGVYGTGSGSIKVSALTRLDDRRAEQVMVVLSALLAHKLVGERLWDVDLVAAFKKHGGENFFFNFNQD